MLHIVAKSFAPAYNTKHFSHSSRRIFLLIATLLSIYLGVRCVFCFLQGVVVKTFIYKFFNFILGSIFSTMT